LYVCGEKVTRSVLRRFVGIFVASDDLVQALAQQRQPRVTHTRIVAIITDALCQAESESIPLIKSSQRRQAGIAGDLATGKISANGAVSSSDVHRKKETDEFDGR